MASNQQVQERVKALVAELLAEEELIDRRANINDIEDAMVRIGDMVAREFGIGVLARHTSQPPEDPPCPDCGHAGERQGEQTRDVITRRGEVPLTEAKYRCPKCRRLFFPQSAALGLEAHYDYTPQMYRRIVFAAAQGVSFADAAEALAELGELKLLPKRVWRATKRIGEERVAECRQAAETYEALPLPAQRASPVAQVPQVACVQMDGGRFQERTRIAAESAALAAGAEEETEWTADAPSEGFWREYKAGVLLSMTSVVHKQDPCPELPATFADPGKMREIAREIKGFTSDLQVAIKADEEAGPDYKERPGGPEMLVKSVVASSGDALAFGPLLASAAYERGFHAARRKAFVADGSATNWGVWRKHFSHYTPILDFVHALMYVYAGAMAGRSPSEGWSHYRDWAQWLWSGEVDRLLAALTQRQQELGLPKRKKRVRRGLKLLVPSII